MTTTTTQVTFVSDVSVSGDEDILRSLSLDTEFNDDFYGADKTTFYVKETAYLKFMSNSESTYTIGCSIGEIKVSATDIPYDVVDTLTFANTSSATLSATPYKSVTYAWLGNDGGIPLFSNRTVTLKENVISVLQCTYKTLGDRLALTVNVEIDALAVVMQDGTNTSLSVEFLDGIDLTPRPYNIEVIDVCTGDKVSGANVYLDDSPVGTTNELGIAFLGDLVPGSSHTLKITCDDYVDSDLDSLDNDGFTVPVEEE